MDRKNKKDFQRGARERADGRPRHEATFDEPMATPVPIKSAVASSIQLPSPYRHPSSPMREPYGPPSGGTAGSPSPGFGHARSPANFASSPNRPSPLSSGNRPSIPGPISLKAAQSPLRPPPTTSFSSSFSHSTFSVHRSGPPLSASFADRRSIWARSEAADEPLSPARRPIQPRRPAAHVDVFVDDGGEDYVPHILSDLLTPIERARRNSRRDSNDSFSASPSKSGGLLKTDWGGERLAQSAGPTMGPPGFLQGLWSAEGADARKAQQDEEDFAFGPTIAQPQQRHSLLTQQRSPISPRRTAREPVVAIESPFLIREPADPHSPSARALQEHAPGQSLPGGLANALSRLHLHGPRPASGLSHTTKDDDEDAPGTATPPPMKAVHTGGRREEHEDEALFTMDG